MKRRSFLQISGATTAALSGITGCDNAARNSSMQTSPSSGNVTLAGKSLEEIREQYRYDLFDDFLAFLDKHVIDHEYGGFMCNTDRDGTNITQNKRGWYEGRGVWVYSFLYNNLDPDPKYI